LSTRIEIVVFGKFQKPKRIELNCPCCGHSQSEPSLVVSSFCRSCGEHFRVRKGIPVAHPGLRVSGIAEVDAPERPTNTRSPRPADEAAPGEVAEDAWLVSADDHEGVRRRLPSGKDDNGDGDIGISAGAFFGLVNGDEFDEEDRQAASGTGAPGKPLGSGTMGALISSQVAPTVPEQEKMPPNYAAPGSSRKSGEPGDDFEVRCFRCYHRQRVSRYAKSTQCDRCSVYISLADYEVKATRTHTIRTRGNVHIGRRGGIVDSEIACHDLIVHGSIDAHVDCTGEAVFKHSGVVRGHLHCRRIEIDKHCEVEFPDGVMTDQVDVHGRLVGNVTCSGLVAVYRSAEIAGDVRTRGLDTQDGGSISGETEIDPETTTEPPSKMGFNPSVIG